MLKILNILLVFQNIKTFLHLLFKTKNGEKKFQPKNVELIFLMFLAIKYKTSSKFNYNFVI